mgnify:CR=1 FL=1
MATTVSKSKLSGVEFLNIEKKAQKILEDSLVEWEKNSPDFYKRINFLRARNGEKRNSEKR